jgi:glutamate-1-semialdehyde aminotransferase
LYSSKETKEVKGNFIFLITAILLIFDEVMTGFRLARVESKLWVWMLISFVLGSGGLPVGAFAARARNHGLFSSLRPDLSGGTSIL